MFGNIKIIVNRRQRRLDIADVQFRPKKGNYVLNGFEIKNVPDFANMWEKICDIVIAKKEED